MKKTISFLLLLGIIFITASCKGENDISVLESESVKESLSGEEIPSETPAATEKSETLQNSENGVRILKAITEIPGTEEITDVDLRAKAVEYMLRMAEVKWVCGTTIDHSQISPNLIYKEGNSYYGMIYNNAYSNLEEFEDCLENGVYSPVSPDPKTTPGNSCSTSVLQAWQTVSPKCNYTYTIDMMPLVCDNGVVAVGDVPWEKYNGKARENGNTIETVLEEMTLDQAYEAYALTKPGDAFMRHTENGGHALMVTGETIVKRRSNGKVDPARSYVILTDQNSSFSYVRDLASSWGYNNKISFVKIFEEGYLPVTIPELRDNRTEKPYFYLDPAPSFENINYGIIRSTVKSNYRMTDLVIELSDENGVAASKSYHPHATSFSLDKAVRSLGNASFPNGKYTLSVTAGTPLLSSEVLRVEFTIDF